MSSCTRGRFDRPLPEEWPGQTYLPDPPKYCLAKDIPSWRKFKRAGVIPFCSKNGKRYYCLGVDTRYGDLTDLAGMVENGEHFMDGAVRELYEESFGLFDYRGAKEKAYIGENAIAFYNSFNLTLLQKITLDDSRPMCEFTRYSRTLFNRLIKRGAPSHLVENREIVWITEDEFHALIRDESIVVRAAGREIKSKLFYKLRRFLREGSE